MSSGPTGYTAAICTARAELRPMVFEGTSFGGAHGKAALLKEIADVL